MSDFDVELEPEQQVEAFEAAAPNLMKASDLLEQEDEVPPEPQDSEEPHVTGEEQGHFLVAPPVPGAKRDRVMYVDEDGAMTPLGVWLESDPTVSGGEMFQLLVEMGLDEENARLYADDRDARLASASGDTHPALASLVEEERKHYELKDEFSRAFVAAQRKKGQA